MTDFIEENDRCNFLYLETLECENKTLKEEYNKILSAHRKMRKQVEDAYRLIKEGATDVPDEMIIATWNGAIPKEAETTDILVALRGSRKVMNSILKQTLDEIIRVLDEGKKESKRKGNETETL